MKKKMCDDIYLKKIFSKNLNRFLSERGIEQHDFALKISMTTVSVNRWVMGKAIPSWDALIAISNALEVNFADLFRDPDEKIPPSSYEFELFRKFRRFADSMRA